jgi:hypothetical protein
MSTDFTPTNELERLLLAAFTDPTVRPRFYRTLLESELFVIVFHDEVGIRIQTAQRDEEEFVPLFSSLGRLEQFAREISLEERQHDHNNGRELLTILESAYVILNPCSGCEKGFRSPEIRGVLDGSEMKKLKILALNENQPTRLTLPATYSKELIEDLKASFAFSKSVKTAYLAQVRQAQNERWQLVIGIEADESYHPSEPIEIAMESLGDDEFITFLKLGNDNISTSMREKITPFYKLSDD